MKTILCMKWGNKYPARYVNILYASVARNITGPFRFICMTDDANDLQQGIEVHPIPELGCQIPPEVPGIWRKTVLWSPGLCGLNGPALFIDLDVVITGNLDAFFEYGRPEDVLLARNPVKFTERLGQSSIFRFPVGGHTYMLDNLRSDPAGVSRKYRFEQRYTTRCIRGGIKFWPKGWVAHFRFHCLGSWVLRYFRPARLPDSAKVVIFPGHPNPEDAVVGKWYPDSEPRTPLGHFLDLETPRKRGYRWRRHITRFLLPVPWVSEHWRE